MKTYIIQNGNTSIVMVPETEIEKLQIKAMFQNPATVHIHIEEKVQVLNSALNDAVVITNKSKEQ